MNLLNTDTQREGADSEKRCDDAGVSHVPKVSVIVPVYKVEKYLPECIESVLVQTFTDFELILVDDGSPDNSGKICDDYATRDSRIRVFHKENGGVTSARRLGVENAQGEWIMFVDGDDLLIIEAIGILVKKITDDVDLVEGGLSQFVGKFKDAINGGKHCKVERTGSAIQYAKGLGQCTWIAGPVAKIYRRKILTLWAMNTSCVFDVGEDVLMNLRASVQGLRKAIKISDVLYLYRRWNMSATKTLKKDEKYWISFLAEIRKIFSGQDSETQKNIVAWHALRILKIFIAGGTPFNRRRWIEFIAPISSLCNGILPTTIKFFLLVRGEFFLARVRKYLNFF